MEEGVTIRDFVALKILCAAIANLGTTCPWIDIDDAFLPRVSYELADKFIEQSNKDATHI